MLDALSDTPSFFSSSGFMPHIHCYLGKPPLVWTMFTTDLLIGIAYVGISLTLWNLVRKIKIPFSFVVLCFGVFIGACGATHFMEVYTLWHPEYWIAALIKVLTALASVGTGIYLYRLRHPLIQVAEAAKLSEQRRLDLEVLTDTLEHRVKERTAELNQALKIRDDFLSVASHEFRTPITAIKLKIEVNRRLIAKGDSLVADQCLKFADEMESQVGKLSKLIEDVLDLSRVRSGRLSLVPVKFNLSKLLDENLEKFIPVLHKNGIEVKANIEPNIEFYGDSMRFEQVFTNLLSNAARYAPAVPLEVIARKHADAIEIVFHDGGKGVHPELSDRIFNRFERLEPKTHREGLGVGLYITSAIVNAHHGEISLDRNAKGGKFVIKLPLAANLKKLDSTISVSDNA